MKPNYRRQILRIYLSFTCLTYRASLRNVRMMSQQEAASEILRARSDCGWTNITGFANGVERANLNRPGSTYSQKSLQVCHERTFCGVARSHLQPFVEGAEVQVLRAKLIKVSIISRLIVLHTELSRT